VKQLYSYLIFILLIVPSVYAQDKGDVPWQKKADFKAEEGNILEDILWLEENPIATSTNDTKVMSEYVLNWLTHTPYLSVTFDEVFLEGLSNNKHYKFAEKFRITYLFGKSYYVITHQDAVEEAAASARGIRGMVKVYQELKKVDPSVKNRILEKYSRLVKSAKVEDYARLQLKKVAVDPYE